MVLGLRLKMGKFLRATTSPVGVSGIIPCTGSSTLLVLELPWGWEVLWHVPHRGSSYPTGVPRRWSCSDGWRWRPENQVHCRAQACSVAGCCHGQCCKWKQLLCRSKVKWLYCRLVWSYHTDHIYVGWGLLMPGAGCSTTDLAALLI